jgi:hypothetical protein
MTTNQPILSKIKKIVAEKCVDVVPFNVLCIQFVKESSKSQGIWKFSEIVKENDQTHLFTLVLPKDLMDI